jgi:rRNA-processing protein FCF1
LLDTNLLVLWLVGKVNPRMISEYKRTRAYDERAFRLLIRVLAAAREIATTPHVLAETSNLIDLGGKLQNKASHEFASLVRLTREVFVPGNDAVGHTTFDRLGLTDAAIHLAAKGEQATVLTDDLDLYLSLEKNHIKALNFSHLRAQTV